MNVQLKALMWFLIKEKDLEHFSDAEAATTVWPNTASPQAFYFETGIYYESTRLNQLSQKWLTEDLPEVATIKAMLESTPEAFPHYKLEEKGNVWHYRNTTKEQFDSRFEDFDWVLIVRFWRQEEGIARIPVPADSVPAFFRLMRLLNGQHTMEALRHLCADDKKQLALLEALHEQNILETTPSRQPLQIADFPELVFLGHSGLALSDKKNLLIIDPVCLPPNEMLSRSHKRPCYEMLGQASAILITHYHWDHLHYQTLCRVPQDTLFLVPRISNPSFSNPPIGDYLRLLGFTNVTECRPGETFHFGDIELNLLPFYGEPIGLNSVFDGVTYYCRFSGKTLLGTVDTWNNETSSMDDVIREIADLKKAPDFYLSSSSGTIHSPAYKTAMPRYMSNELKDKPEFIRFIPDIDDVIRWTEWLKPRYLIPYAELYFHGNLQPDLQFEMLSTHANNSLDIADNFFRQYNYGDFNNWITDLKKFQTQTGTPVIRLQPMQGINFTQRAHGNPT